MQYLHLVVQVLDNLGERNRRSVGSRRNESAQDSLRKSRSRAARKELEQLNQQVVVQVFALGVFLGSVLNSTSSN